MNVIHYHGPQWFFFKFLRLTVILNYLISNYQSLSIRFGVATIFCWVWRHHQVEDSEFIYKATNYPVMYTCIDAHKMYNNNDSACIWIK